MPNRRSGDGVSTARLTVFLTLLAVGMLVGAMLAPRAAWGQTLGVGRQECGDPVHKVAHPRVRPESNAPGFCDSPQAFHILGGEAEGLGNEGDRGRRVKPTVHGEIRHVGTCGAIVVCRAEDIGPLVTGERAADSSVVSHALNIAPNAPKYQSPRYLAIPVAALWLASVYHLGALDEIHHFYYGVPLLFARPRWVQWVGLAIMADDSYQHARQWSGDRSYQSPLHKAYGLTLYRWFR